MRRLLLLLALGLTLPHARAAAVPAPPSVQLRGLPARVASGQAVPLELTVAGAPGSSVAVEVTTLLADRAVERSSYQVPLQEGKGEKKIALVLPETRVRVPVRVTIGLATRPAALARVDALLLPRWDSARLTEVLRGREVGVVERERLIAPALGKLPFQEITSTDPLGIERFLGDLLICRMPQFAVASEAVVAALAHQLTQGRSVVWLVAEEESVAVPPLLHSGPLQPLEWPFVLQPGTELRVTEPEDLQHWAGSERTVPLPRAASFGSAWLVVCSERILTKLPEEPAAGWLWEDVLAWAARKPATPGLVKRLHFVGGERPPQPGAAPEAALLLSLRDESWVEPGEPRLEWLAGVRQFVAQGNGLLVTGAASDRAAALRALGLPALEFVPAPQRPDVVLGPNLLLWGLPQTDPSYRVLVSRGEKPLLEAFLGTRSGPQVLGEFAVGKGLVLLCQADLDVSQAGAEAGLLEHLARQLLTPPGRVPLDAESR